MGACALSRNFPWILFFLDYFLLWQWECIYFVGEVEEDEQTADELALTSSRIYLVDSGLVFNSPYPPLLRPERDVDVFLSFDFSVRKRDVEFPFKVKRYFKTRLNHWNTVYFDVPMCYVQ